MAEPSHLLFYSLAQLNGRITLNSTLPPVANLMTKELQIVFYPPVVNLMAAKCNCRKTTYSILPLVTMLKAASTHKQLCSFPWSTVGTQGLARAFFRPALEGRITKTRKKSNPKTLYIVVGTLGRSRAFLWPALEGQNDRKFACRAWDGHFCGQP